MFRAKDPIPRRVFLAYFWLCMGLLGLILGSRALYYSFRSLPGWIEDAVEALLQSYLVFFARAFGVLILLDVAFVLLLLLFASWPRGFWAPRGPSRRLRPWVYAVVGTMCLVNHYLFDADPLLSQIIWATFVALAAATVHFRGRPPAKQRRILAAAVALLILGVGWATSPTPVTTVAIAVWGLLLAFFGFAATRWLRPGDGLLFALVLMPLCNFVIPTILIFLAPTLRHSHPTTLERRGYAYGYCESPAHHQLFMTVPVGQTGDMEQLELGYVAEYDSRDLTQRKEHDLFDDDLYGGLRMILCVGDVVQITMNGANIRGNVSGSNVIEFDVDSPQRRRVSIFDEALRTELGWDLLGHAAAYDAQRDAVFYVSEWTNKVFRLDRKTGELNTRIGEQFPNKELSPLQNFGLQTGPRAVHRGRRTLYLSEWADGSRIYELDLDTLRVVRHFDTHDTGSFGLGVDEAADRLFASGLWGVNVIDLRSGEISMRMRTGPGARGAVIDADRDLVYIPTTFGGHVWVFDRISLEPRGRLTTGLGGRPAYLSNDGRHFFASDQTRVLCWDARELAERFHSLDDTVDD